MSHVTTQHSNGLSYSAVMCTPIFTQSLIIKVNHAITASTKQRL